MDRYCSAQESVRTRCIAAIPVDDPRESSPWPGSAMSGKRTGSCRSVHRASPRSQLAKSARDPIQIRGPCDFRFKPRRNPGSQSQHRSVEPDSSAFRSRDRGASFASRSPHSSSTYLELIARRTPLQDRKTGKLCRRRVNGIAAPGLGDPDPLRRGGVLKHSAPYYANAPLPSRST